MHVDSTSGFHKEYIEGGSVLGMKETLALFMGWATRMTHLEEQQSTLMHKISLGKTKLVHHH